MIPKLSGNGMETPLRYHRQQLLPWIGAGGQQRISAAQVLLIGCGALGTVLAEQLARAGVGKLRIADRDIVEMSNLQRQTLFDESDVADELPKAVAAARRLRRINSTIEIEPRVVDVHSGNIESLADFSGRPPALILDGTDNAPTRYLINDLAVREAIPWIYVAAVGTEGRAMAVLPGGACLRCIFREAPRPGEIATCDTAGVLGATPGVIASYQAALALQILSGNAEAAGGRLLTVDLWSHRFHTVDTSDAKRDDCPCCAEKRFEFLDAPAAGDTSLCGRDAVQIRAGGKADVAAMVARLSAVGTVQQRPYFVQCELTEPRGFSLTIFPDGRTIVRGTGDVARARAIAAKYLAI